MAPRLRTMTGCLDCTVHPGAGYQAASAVKKCDERKPRCKWPTTDHFDGRRYQHNQRTPPSVSGPISVDHTSPVQQPQPLPQPRVQVQAQSWPSSSKPIFGADNMLRTESTFLFQYCFGPKNRKRRSAQLYDSNSRLLSIF